MDEQLRDYISVNTDDFSNLLRVIRLRRSLTQMELAEKAGVKQQTISAIENGRLDPSLKVLLPIAHSLGVVLLIGLQPNEEVNEMSINLIKELEDIRAETTSVSEKLSELRTERITQYLTDAAAEFMSFFKDKGFSVQRDRHAMRYVASYGNFSVQITLPDAKQSFVGIMSRIDMKTSTGKSYIIPIGKLGSYPRFVTTYMGPAPKTEEEKIQRDIADAKRFLAEIQTDLENFGSTEWSYGLKDEKEEKWQQYPQYRSFVELLANAFPN